MILEPESVVKIPIASDTADNACERYRPEASHSTFIRACVPLIVTETLRIDRSRTALAKFVQSIYDVQNFRFQGYDAHRC